jgi:hypothetical protein
MSLTELEIGEEFCSSNKRSCKFCRSRPSSSRKGGKTSYHIAMIFLTMELR